jgi:hypothetical protein
VMSDSHDANGVIGILRCVDADARDMRRIFATEGPTVARAG